LDIIANRNFLQKDFLTDQADIENSIFTSHAAMLKTIIWFAASTSSHISSQFEQSRALKRNKGRTIGNGLRDLKGIANISAKHSELSTVSTKREMSAPGPCVTDSFRLSGSVLCKN